MAKLNGVTLVSERISYKGAEYVKSDEAAVAGDIVRCDESGLDRTEGAFYEVVRVDSFGDPRIIDDASDEVDADTYVITVFKRVEVAVIVGKADDIVFYEGVKYREVKRKANVGERIRIVNPVCALDYGKGDEFEVTRVDDDGAVRFLDRVDANNCAYLREYVVLEPTEPSVKQTDNPVDSRLKVGEYAKVIGGDNYQTKIGDIVVIRSIDNDGTGDYRVNDLNGKELQGHKKARNVIRATDAEVAEAKRQAEQARKEATQKAEQTALEAKWSAIGRKVNEFKAGDIVKTIEIPNGITNGHPFGVVGSVTADTIVRGPRNGNPSVECGGQTYHNNCELIAPVESLFTR